MSYSLLSELRSENLFLFCDESRKPLSRVDASVSALIRHAVDFRGRLREVQIVYPAAPSKTKRILLIGLGAVEKVSLQSFRSATAQGLLSLRNLGQTQAHIALPIFKKFSAEELSQAIGEATEISQLNFFQFRTDRKEDEKARYEKIQFSLALNDRKESKAAEIGWSRGVTIGQGVNWGRSLILLPGSHLPPAELAAAAQKMVQQSPSKSKIKIQIWEEKELQKNKFGGVLGVGQGSVNPPRFIVLEYRGGRSSDAPVALVGKGVTFDSGGLSLKPPQAMETMKYDMAGAASVLSVFKILTDLRAKVNLLVFVPSAENMPSGSAIRPGDVLRMASGRTVEVLNTDAEGRLLLADALYWASEKYKPRCILDVATLTGACAAALGEAGAGVFSNSKKLWAALSSSAETVNEGVWPLPNFPEVYGPMIKSDIADVKNTGGKHAGASTASMFLQYFVQNSTPWAHFDIAGSGWYDSPRDMVTSRGPSGIPIRTLVEFVESHATSKFN